MAKTRLESNIEMNQSEYHQPIHSNGKIMRFANSIQFLSFLAGFRSGPKVQKTSWDISPNLKNRSQMHFTNGRLTGSSINCRVTKLQE